MTADFAMKWAYAWLALFGAFAFAGLTFRIPLPSMGWCLAMGAVHGAVLVGPIVWIAFRDADR